MQNLLCIWGGMTTAARYITEDRGSLGYLVFDNESNKSTGGQNTYQRHLNYRKIAQGSGFYAYEQIVKNIDGFKVALNTVSDHRLYMMHVKCAYDNEMPRPPMDVVKQSIRVFFQLGCYAIDFFPVLKFYTQF